MKNIILKTSLRIIDFVVYLFIRLLNVIHLRMRSTGTDQYSAYNLNYLIEAFKYIAWSGIGSNKCLEKGKFLPVPVHFHSPIPDIQDLAERKIWDVKNELRGIDFRPDEQVNLLKKLGEKFSAECNFPPNPTDNPTVFFTENGRFSFGCAASLHCMIRHYKPKRIIEVGSGMSSLVIARASAMNKAEDASSIYTIIDPYPGEVVERGLLGDKLIKARVELLDVSLFEELSENDILFIDSSHSVKIGGDVNYLLLDVIPRLAVGVVIHLHDISLPYEYDRFYATNEGFRQFWTEQYLLQGFLCCNDYFEVLLAMQYLQTDFPHEFKKAFHSSYSPEYHLLGTSSFWMRRKK
jgi:predicted O-methyltransferase YrrM